MPAVCGVKNLLLEDIRFIGVCSGGKWDAVEACNAYFLFCKGELD